MTIIELIEEISVKEFDVDKDLFAVLNRLLNEKGYMLNIEGLDHDDCKLWVKIIKAV